MVTSKAAIGPMSRRCIEAVIKYANENDVQLMLISSRRQVECEELGVGYVENFTSSQFARFVRERDTGNMILVCRDHGGPYQGHDEEHLDPERAVAQAVLCMKQDIDAGFDLIHVDCGIHKGDVREATAHILTEVSSYARSIGRSVLFEVGTEQNVGVSTSLNKFKEDLDFILRYAEPEFVVGQTGSLIKEVFQVGTLDFRTTKELTDIAHSAGVKFKEHNADYLDDLALSLRRPAGVDAINVAPEFGVAETRVVATLASRYGFFDELSAFQRRALESGRWQKWLYGSASDSLKAEIAGHYCFMSDEYGELVDKLSAETDVHGAIIERLTALIDHYVRGLN